MDRGRRITGELFGRDLEEVGSPTSCVHARSGQPGLSVAEPQEVGSDL